MFDLSTVAESLRSLTSGRRGGRGAADESNGGGPADESDSVATGRSPASERRPVVRADGSGVRDGPDDIGDADSPGDGDSPGDSDAASELDAVSAGRDPLDDTELVARGLDALDDVFYVYDAGQRLVRWNERLEEVFGANEEDLAGREPASFFLPADRERVEAAVREVVETGETTGEARADTPRGVVWFELTGRRLDVDGEAVGFSGIGRDITERREREARLALQNERLDAFADVVSHDLRNPLQVATGLLELEQRDRDRERGGPAGTDSGRDDRLERIADALDRMGRIVDDVLVAAREGDGIEDPVPVALATVARDTWETVETPAATLEVRTDRVVAGDADRLDRLFGNLYRNAVEHGGDEVTVTVGDTDTGFFVADDGAGIADEGLERVFESGVSSARDGTGLGLDIVERVATAHCWTVTAENVPGGGARFVFDLGSHGTIG